MSGKEFLCCMAFLGLLAFEQGSSCQVDSFARPSGTSFLVNGLPFYANGFNAYWLMDKAFDPYEREKVTSAFKDASSYGLTIVRTWAFSDGGGRALQISPGNYNEEMFKVKAILSACMVTYFTWMHIYFILFFFHVYAHT